jgi:hypothetical protein
MSAKRKARLDVLVAERGLAENSTLAAALVLAGSVTVNGRPAAKPGQAYAADAVIALRENPLPYVSRGGIKLAGALDHFSLQVQGKLALDVGASTGGFTDCLLKRGAAKGKKLPPGMAAAASTRWQASMSSCSIKPPRGRKGIILVSIFMKTTPRGGKSNHSWATRPHRHLTRNELALVGSRHSTSMESGAEGGNRTHTGVKPKGF